MAVLHDYGGRMSKLSDKLQSLKPTTLEKVKESVAEYLKKEERVKSIKEERESLESLSVAIRKRLKVLQARCDHMEATVHYKSDTGNCCKSDDRYWKEYHCPECGKRWEEEQ